MISPGFVALGTHANQLDVASKAAAEDALMRRDILADESETEAS